MSYQRSYNWVQIASSVEELHFEKNNIALVQLAERLICIGRYQDKLFGFARGCPHASAFLSDGFIDALGNVVCPLHHYRFSISNGRNTSGEGYHLKHWPVEIRAAGVFVGL